MTGRGHEAAPSGSVPSASLRVDRTVARNASWSAAQSRAVSFLCMGHDRGFAKQEVETGLGSESSHRKHEPSLVPRGAWGIVKACSPLGRCIVPMRSSLRLCDGTTCPWQVRLYSAGIRVAVERLPEHVRTARMRRWDVAAYASLHHVGVAAGATRWRWEQGTRRLDGNDLQGYGIAVRRCRRDWAIIMAWWSGSRRAHAHAACTFTPSGVVLLVRWRCMSCTGGELMFAGYAAVLERAGALTAGERAGSRLRLWRTHIPVAVLCRCARSRSVMFEITSDGVGGGSDTGHPRGVAAAVSAPVHYLT